MKCVKQLNYQNKRETVQDKRPALFCNIKERKMKKIVALLVLCSLAMVASCSHKCETEPIVESNHKLIVPPDFGNMPK